MRNSRPSWRSIGRNISPIRSWRSGRYISTPTRRGRNAESDARQVLAQLAAGADPDTFGDPTLLESEVRLSPLWDIRKQFGDEFGRGLLELKPGKWAGPIRSGFGLHLVWSGSARTGVCPT